MKHVAVFSDGQGNWVFETRKKGPMQMRYGVLTNAAGGVGPESPVASIAGHMPDSDFKPFAGELPPAVKKLIDEAPEPSDD